MGSPQPRSQSVVAVMDYPVHNLCMSLHDQTNNYEADVKHWLRKLAELNEFGFAAGTLPVLQLIADARKLRGLADMIDVQVQQLTRKERTK